MNERASTLLDDVRRTARSLSPAVLTRIRTIATLTALLLLLFLAVRIGVDRVSEPFPESSEPPVCIETAVEAGDTVAPGDVTVSVINAGGANGLAGRTLSELTDRGFGRGNLSDAPDGSPKVVRSQIWTTDGETAAVELVRTYLLGKVTVVEREGLLPGVNVVVGTKFRDVKDGKAQATAEDDETTCVPTTPAETPTPDAPESEPVSGAEESEES